MRQITIKERSEKQRWWWENNMQGWRPKMCWEVVPKEKLKIREEAREEMKIKKDLGGKPNAYDFN